MIPRLTFFLIAAFWVTMNVLLWRAEYGAHGGEISVPVEMVWQKILTAPDASSLNIFQDGQRTGYCEFSTGVGTAMAELDESSPPPAGVATRAGYKIRMSGNMGLGAFTNRIHFNGQFQFATVRDWRELSLKVSTSELTVGIHSLATNQMIALEISSDGTTELHMLHFADLHNPGKLLGYFAGDSGIGFSGGWLGGLLGGFAPPQLPAMPALTQNLDWQAHRERLKIGREAVSVYRLETQVLGNKIVIYVSTLGEILRVDLPGGITAMIEDWGKP